MSTSFARDLARALEFAGFGVLGGTGPGWSIQVSREPEEPPIDVITVYDTGTQEAPLTHLPFNRPTAQVRVRAQGYMAGHDRISNILEQLVGMDMSEILASDLVSKYHSIQVISGPIPIGRTDRDRFIFSLNLSAHQDVPDGVHRIRAGNTL